ncbi:MAG: DUF2726 domain-containing protein [Bacillus sp. (in: Bacteria)]|nr:DUF2726 domain-containing protein [Bacillus sp. (in: firmicutes)]
MLGADEFRELDYVMHQPLRMLIKDVEKLSDEERKFAMNILTHTDFILFRKVDKTPVLVVEVDGHAFHSGNARQLERDKMKDEILRKYGVPVLRLATTGSGEEERLRRKLRECVK